jgi:ATP-dependent Clp protease protease subunit
MSNDAKDQRPYTTLDSRGVYLFFEGFHPASARNLCHWILEKNFNPGTLKYLTMVINSPGGNIIDAFAIIDIMNGSSLPIYTVGLGEICSAGFATFINGKKGHRVLTPNTQIMSHQFSWGTHGKEHDLISDQKEVGLVGDRMLTHYKKCTGLSEKVIRQKLLPESNVWLSAQEALKLGVCDKIEKFDPK